MRRNIKYDVVFTDDDTNTVGLYRRIFSEILNVPAYVTIDPKQSFERAIESNAKLFITDLVKSEGLGTIFIRQLRENVITQNIAIWVISGSAKDLWEQSMIAGADLVLPKPWKLDDLVKRLNRLFGSNSDPDIATIQRGSESPEFDYKEIIDLASKDGRAAFAKDVIGFANYGGGTIVVGVKEVDNGGFDWVGVDAQSARLYEVSNLNKAVIEYIEPAIHVSVRNVTHAGKVYKIIEIPSANKMPVLARKENATAGIFKGRIYSRSSCAETKEITRSEEMRALLARFRGL